MGSTHRILIVDDEPMVTKGCHRILTEQGYQVDTTQSGQDGLSRALAQSFVLVVTDLRMPDLDGMELVRALRRKQPQTAIIVLTGYGTVPSAVEAMRLGVSGYLEKPFTPEQITEAVHDALGNGHSKSKAEVEGRLVRKVLREAARNRDFGRRLLFEGSRVLSGCPLSSQAKAAIVSGDIVWIEKEYGDLTQEERSWLHRRLEAEIW